MLLFGFANAKNTSTLTLKCSMLKTLLDNAKKKKNTFLCTDVGLRTLVPSYLSRLYFNQFRILSTLSNF